MTDLVKIKRDGPKGYKFIASDSFDPKLHELFDAPAKAAAPKAAAKPKAK